MTLPPLALRPLCVRDPMYGCWRYSGTKGADGYGRFSGGRMAHLAVWEDERGPIPVGLVLDHLCRRRDCINPCHLDMVKQSENLKRRSWRYRRRIAKCPQGHDLKTFGRLTPEGGRICRKCSGV